MIFLASDHAGFSLKEKLKKFLIKQGNLIEDLSLKFVEGDDYPDYAPKLCKKVLKTGGRGILICGTGQGMAITANRIKGIRAALCWDVKSARYSRLDNDSNVLVLGSWITDYKKSEGIVNVWLKTKFSKKPRHIRRIKKIDKK